MLDDEEDIEFVNDEGRWESSSQVTGLGVMGWGSGLVDREDRERTEETELSSENENSLLSGVGVTSRE